MMSELVLRSWYDFIEIPRFQQYFEATRRPSLWKWKQKMESKVWFVWILVD